MPKGVGGSLLLDFLWNKTKRKQIVMNSSFFSHFHVSIQFYFNLWQVILLDFKWHFLIFATSMAYQLRILSPPIIWCCHIMDLHVSLYWDESCLTCYVSSLFNFEYCSVLLLSLHLKLNQMCYVVFQVPCSGERSIPSGGYVTEGNTSPRSTFSLKTFCLIQGWAV